MTPLRGRCPGFLGWAPRSVQHARIRHTRRSLYHLLAFLSLLNYVTKRIFTSGNHFFAKTIVFFTNLTIMFWSWERPRECCLFAKFGCDRPIVLETVYHFVKPALRNHYSPLKGVVGLGVKKWILEFDVEWHLNWRSKTCSDFPESLSAVGRRVPKFWRKMWRACAEIHRIHERMSLGARALCNDYVIVKWAGSAQLADVGKTWKWAKNTVTVLF